MGQKYMQTARYCNNRVNVNFYKYGLLIKEKFILTFPIEPVVLQISMKNFIIFIGSYAYGRKEFGSKDLRGLQ